MDISVVIPAFQEGQGIARCLAEVARVLAPSGLAWEMVVVDDGSTDDTWDRMREAAPRGCTLIRLAANAGQQSALRIGLAHSRGAAVITFDSDLQVDPACLPVLARRVLAGSDVVSGARKERADGLARSLASRLGNLLVSAALGVRQADFGAVKAYSAAMVERLLALPPEDLVLPAAAIAMASRFEEVGVQHAPRLTGESKWPLRRRVALLASICRSAQAARRAVPTQAGPGEARTAASEVVRT